MTSTDALPNSIKARRTEQHWSQEDLAERAGISRAAVSAIESQRLVPSVATALALARVFNCQVESLFGTNCRAQFESTWAWAPPSLPWRYWQAEVFSRMLMFPVDHTGQGSCPHDGVCEEGQGPIPVSKLARETLTMACCDPAAGILGTEYQRRTGMRLLVLTRSSSNALELLKNKTIHVAGVHFSTQEHQSGNETLVREKLGEGYCLVRAASWQAGVAVAGGFQARSVKGLVKSDIRWVGREVGSGARRCLDEILKPGHQYEHVASDHRSVSEAVRHGWADAGVCVRLVSEEAGLHFLPVQQEAYDLCFPKALEHEARIQALIALLQSTAYRKLISELPGYDVRDVGEVRVVTS